MKKFLKVIGIIALVIVGIVAFLLVKNFIDSQKPFLKDNYYKDFKSEAELEKKYAGLGSYEVSDTVIKSDNKTIKKYRIWYPTEMENSQKTYPMIIMTNASNTAALNAKPFFQRLASWGFIVVGNDDRQAGTGVTTSETLDYMLNMNKNSDSVFCGKIDENNIGIVGYSQGGAGAIRAVTEFENSNKYKTIFTGSAAYAYLAQMWGGYDPAKVTIPWLMNAGTGNSDDRGITADLSSGEFAGVAPLASLKENYNAVSNEVIKLRCRAVGAEHEDMLTRSDGYMTAWMLWHLCEDEEAAKVFVGENAEILTNANWQDIEKNH